MSSEALATQETLSQHQEGTTGVIKIRFAIHKRQDSPDMGIGATAMEDNQHLIKSWAAKDRSTGHHHVDELVAIKLLMSKALMLRWRKIEMQIQNKQALNCILSRKSHDIRQATLMEDIYQLSLLFQKCSFCPVSKDGNHICDRISSYAIGIFEDEDV